MHVSEKKVLSSGVVLGKFFILKWEYSKDYYQV